MDNCTITWTGNVADLKVCHLDLPSREKLPGGMQWATASNCSACRICPSVQIKTRLSLSSSLERINPAWVPEHGNFLPIRNSLVSNLCTSGPHQAKTFSELHQSLRLLWPSLSSFAFTFTSVNLHCRLSLPEFAPSALYLVQVFPPWYLCIFNSTLVSAFRRARTHRKNWVSVRVIYLSGGPSSEDLQSDHFPYAIMGVVLLLPSLFCFSSSLSH